MTSEWQSSELECFLSPVGIPNRAKRTRGISYSFRDRKIQRCLDFARYDKKVHRKSDIVIPSSFVNVEFFPHSTFELRHSAHLSRNVNISSPSETIASFTTQWHFALANRSPRDLMSSAWMNIVSPGKAGLRNFTSSALMK